MLTGDKGWGCAKAHQVLRTLAGRQLHARETPQLLRAGEGLDRLRASALQELLAGERRAGQGGLGTGSLLSGCGSGRASVARGSGLDIVFLNRVSGSCRNLPEVKG